MKDWEIIRLEDAKGTSWGNVSLYPGLDPGTEKGH